MLTPELIAIVDRIATGTHTDADIQALREALGGAVAAGERSVAVQGDANGATITTGNGNIVLNITFQSDGVQIDDRRYQGTGAEALRAIIQELLRPTLEIDWQQVSRSFLDEQLRLTTNPLTAGEGISYRTEQVYVPLGLVERKRQTRRGEDVSPEQGSLLYEEVEITQRFENEQFLEQVLQQGKSPKSRGKRIAIIGEPGAGKTTLLQQIAQWVSGQEGAIAIWVSLADLRGHELEPHLLERWLQAAVRQVGQAEASNQVKDAFVTQFQQGRVWLLLDGVDEMQISSGNPLAEIERQVRMGGLLSQARIVLSCRLNLWDGNRHALLDTFDTYRTLEFSYPQQVEQFIGQWFGVLPETQEVRAERLCVALKAPGKERIQDLVKNPLRLTLLCFNWYLGEGSLPETKAGLYEQFVKDFYEWNRERCPTTVKQRRQLNETLGELAREAIDKEPNRFQLQHNFICRFLGEPDDKNSLFQLALQLGWLNKIGVEIENTQKRIYAFFHPTFQEHFAALAIKDERFFLNHVSKNPSDSTASYRVFEPQWKEVFLIWLGRSEISNIQRNKMINNLNDFEDQCGGFYSVKASLIAAEGINEFNPKSKDDYSNEIKKIFDQCFGTFDCSNQKWGQYLEPIRMASKATLQYINKSYSLPIIQKQLELLIKMEEASEERDKFILYIAIFLCETRLNNEMLIEVLEWLLKNSQNEFIPWETVGLILSFLWLNGENDRVISSLINFIKSQKEIALRRGFIFPISQLHKEEISLPNTTSALLNIISNTSNMAACISAIYVLEVICSEKHKAICILSSLVLNCSNTRVQIQAAYALASIGVGISSTKYTLISWAKQNLQDKETCLEAARILSIIDADNSFVVELLFKLVKECSVNCDTNENANEDTISVNAIIILREISSVNPDAISALKNLMVVFRSHPINYHLAEAISETNSSLPCISKVSLESFVELVETAQDDERKLQASLALGKIDPGNSLATKTLIELALRSEDGNTRMNAAVALREINPHNSIIFNTLVNIIHSFPSSIPLGNTTFLYGLAGSAAYHLKEVALTMTNMFDIIILLKGHLSDSSSENDFHRFETCFNMLWHCSENMKYSVFHEAFNKPQIDYYLKLLEVKRILEDYKGEADCLFMVGFLYGKMGKFRMKQSYVQQAVQVLYNANATLDEYPFHPCVRSLLKLFSR